MVYFRVSKLGSIHRTDDALDRVQMKVAQFSNHMKDFDWVNLAQCKTITCLCELFKAYSGEWAWIAIHNRMRKPHYLSRAGHVHLERKKQNVMLW
jgi:hypothetical protein